MVDPPLFTLAAPIMAMILLSVLRRSGRWRRWTEIGAAVLVALIVLLAPWLTSAPAHGAVALIAFLVSADALADAFTDTIRARPRQIARVLRLAGVLIAVLSVHPLIAWAGLAIASSAGVSTRLPRIPSVLRQLSAVNVALGIALFGLVAVEGGAIPLGAVALLLGWGALVWLEPALLPPVMLLALRMQDRLAGAPAGGPLSDVMIFGGAVAVVIAALIHLLRPGRARRPALLMLAQGAITACAFGLGGSELRFAGLLHLALLILCDCALLLSSANGLDRIASLVSLSGLPPVGVFPSLVLILFGVAIRMPWLLVPIMAGVLALGWATATRLPSVNGPLRPSPAWVPLLLVLLLGIAMPAPLAAWFQTLAKAAP